MIHANREKVSTSAPSGKSPFNRVKGSCGAAKETAHPMSTVAAANNDLAGAHFSWLLEALALARLVARF
jgi:hypothetical protein